MALVAFDIDEFDLDPHPDRDVGGRASNDVGHELGSLLEFHVCKHIGTGLPKGRKTVLVRNREAVNGTATTRHEVLDRIRQAGHAERARSMLCYSAGAATLQDQLVPSTTLPVGTRFPVRRRSFVSNLFGHFVEFTFYPIYPRLKSNVAPLWSAPSTPPVPCTHATSAATT